MQFDNMTKEKLLAMDNKSLAELIGRISTAIGADQRKTLCEHWPGQEYDGQLCHFELDGAADAYEVSLVAVPAQPEAGIVKAKRYGGAEMKETHAPEGADNDEHWADEAALELEKMRF